MVDPTENAALLKDDDEDKSDSSNEGCCHKIYKVITSNEWLFYYCGIISTWDDRSWYFLVGIYLVALDTSNLTLAAIYGFFASGFVILLGSAVGSWIDRTPRLKAAYIVLIFRNFSIFITSVVLCLVFFYYQEVVVENKYPILLLLAKICLVTFGVVAHLTGLTNNTIVGKDWLGILCLGDNVMLSKMSSRLRLLDMVSKIIAPVFIGQVMTFAGNQIAAIVFSVQVMLSLLLYGNLLSIIYKRMPRLHYRENTQHHDSEPLNIPNEDTYSYQEIGFNEEGNEDEIPEVSMTASSCSKKCSQNCNKFIGGWKVYFSQSIWMAGISLALIFMTVLGFDTITTGYALSQGMREFTLSLFNSGAAVTGIVGAILFPYVRRCLGSTVPTGCVALLLQVIGLVPCIVSVWSSGSPYGIPPSNVTYNSTVTTPSSSNYDVPYPQNEWSWSLMLLMSGIVASRVGLWMFDLTTNQLLIETVPEIHRGKVNGVQSSLNMLFDLMKFTLVLVFPLPLQFGLLVILSVAAIVFALIFYFIFAISKGCHLESVL